MGWIIVSFIVVFSLGGSLGMILMGMLALAKERGLVEMLCRKIDELLKENERLRAEKID